MADILLVTPRFISGGIENFIINVIKNKKNREINYALLLYQNEFNNEYVAELKKYGIKIYCANSDKYKGIVRKIYEPIFFFYFLKNNHFDIVHIHQTVLRRSIDLFLAKVAGVPVRIIHSHGSKGLKKESLFIKIKRSMLKNLYLYAATDFWACSEDAAIYLFPPKIIRNNRYSIIKNGIDIGRYAFDLKKRNDIRNKFGIEENCLLLGTVGRLTYFKNHEFMIQILKAAKERCDFSVKLLIVGDGELKGHLSSITKKEKLENDVIFAGDVTDTNAYLSAMDCFLFTSITEGLGIAAIEAQCNGLPVFIGANLPKETSITSNTVRLNLKQGADAWCECIIEKPMKRIDGAEAIRKTGYDICDVVNGIEMRYLNTLEGLKTK